jgi:hypothetical protein
MRLSASYWLAISPALFLTGGQRYRSCRASGRMLVSASHAVVALLGLNAWAAPLREPPQQQLARSQASPKRSVVLLPEQLTRKAPPSRPRKNAHSG